MSTAEQLVFVSLYIMLGDADGSIEGTQVLSKKKWDKEVRGFENFLKKQGISDIESDSEWGIFYMNLENYTTKPITAEEAEVLKKFFGSSSGSFRLPSRFTENYDD